MRVIQVSLLTITGITLFGICCYEPLFATPPSRQTPSLVSRDKQGVIEIGPCQLPPAVGGQPCTPNARDFGYFEGTWRKWPTQQRYDQNFPQAIGATPIQPKSVRPAQEAPIAPDSTALPYQSPSRSQEFTLPEIVPDTLPGNLSVSPAPGGELPSVSPEKNNSTDASFLPMLTPERGTEATSAPPSSGPAPTALPEIESPEASEEDSIPSLDTEIPEEDISLPLPSSKASPSAPHQSPASPLEDSELLPDISSGEEKEEVLLPGISHSESGMRSVLNSMSQQIPQSRTNPAEASVSESLQTLNPFEKSAAMQDSRIAAASPVTIKPAGPSLPIPANWEARELTGGVEEVSQTSFSLPTSSLPESAVGEGMSLGLEGFCPVTLLQSEQWVEGDSRWSVVHHGITYHLASADLVPIFLSNPQQFTPVSDGNDPVALRDSGQAVTGSADYCVVYEGKLYMFSTEITMNQFFTNADRYR